MKSRIMYIERKTGTSEAFIGDKAFASIGESHWGANYHRRGCEKRILAYDS